MNNGMLWFDNDPHTMFDDKVRQAADYYCSKYGLVATVCTVNPSMYPVAIDQAYQVGEIAIKHSRSIMPNHLWVCGDQMAVSILQIPSLKPAGRSREETKQLSFSEV